MDEAGKHEKEEGGQEAEEAAEDCHSPDSQGVHNTGPFPVDQ